MDRMKKEKMKDQSLLDDFNVSVRETGLMDCGVMRIVFPTLLLLRKSMYSGRGDQQRSL